MKKFIRNLFVVCIGIYFLSGCSGTSSSSTAGNIKSSASLVSAAWVKQVIDYHKSGSTTSAPADYPYPTSHKYLILETQWGPLTDAAGLVSWEPYNNGHIPGAIHSDTDPWENGDPSYFLLPDADLKARAGALGITKDTTVIVYSDNVVFTARLWWLLKYIGVTDVRFLDGGYAAWTAAGYAGETNNNNPVATTYDGTVNSAMIATTADVQTATASPATTQIVDVRSNREYLGYTTGYSYLDGKGRIPGSIWAEDGSSSSYSNADGTLLSPTVVKNMWTAHGVTSSATKFDKDVIVYCGGGYRSALAYFYAYLLGYNNIRNYADGWAGWGTTYTGAPGSIVQAASGRQVEAGSFNVGFPTAGKLGLLASGAALASNLGKANQVIIDVRNSADYAAGHISGAINLEPKNLNVIAGFNSGLKPTADIATTLGAAGISNTPTIVVYGTDVDAVPGRMFWILEYLGAKDVHVLDGGYAKWTADGRATVTTATTATATTFAATEDPTKIAMKSEVLANYADTTNYAIVDARFNPDYVIAHIPNAINVLIGDFQNTDKTVKSYADLTTLLTSKNISVTTRKKIFTHCYVGWMSGQEYLMFRLMGFDVKNYNGSWTEWAADTTPLPTKAGATP